jgi:RAB protein geranylgeranyltransferase component A
MGRTIQGRSVDSRPKIIFLRSLHFSDSRGPFRNITLWKSEAEAPTPSEKLSFSRAYTLTLSPQIIYTKSKLLAQLVSSKVYRQLEFQAVGNWWIYDVSAAGPGVSSNATLKRLPNGREDIFEDRSIDNRAKRSLMKFLKFVVDYESHTDVWEAQAERSLPELLASQFQLPAQLQTVIFALTLSLDSPEKTTVAYSLPRIARHLTSIGIFGPGFGAVVPKWGGGAEIAQVACRAGAVGGGVYVLGTGIKSTQTVAEGQLIEITLSNSETAKTKHLAGEKTVRDDESPDSKAVSKVIAVASSPLTNLFESSIEGSPLAAVSVIVFPAGTLGSEELVHSHPIYIMAHSSDTGECPAGQCQYLSFLSRFTNALYDDPTYEYLSTLSEFS